MRWIRFVRSYLNLSADLVNLGRCVIVRPANTDLHMKVRQIMFNEILFRCLRKNI
jgi:hypothetical protein